MADDPVDLSIRYLREARRGEDPTGTEAAINELDPGEIESLGEGGRKAFWINLYNAATQHLLAKEPDRYESRRRFFGAELIDVAGRDLSLDDVEHGMLRRSRFKWALGYLAHPRPDAFKRRLRVETVDPRVHFALNCGAESCPPIAAYTADEIDDQLDLATESYLQSEVAYVPDEDIVRVPRLFLWFRGDFGGKSGILDLLRSHDLVPEDIRPRLKHRSYDWSLARGNWAERFEG